MWKCLKRNSSLCKNLKEIIPLLKKNDFQLFLLLFLISYILEAKMKHTAYIELD